MMKGEETGMSIIDVNGETLAFRRAGKGPALLLIHSLGTASWLWEGEIEAWKSHRDVIAFDCRGHGGSSARGGFTVRGVAEDLAAALDALDVGPADVLAISMGGPIAAHLVDIAPLKVRRLVIADSFAAQGEAGAKRAEMVAETIRTSSMAEYGAAYARDTLAEDIDPVVAERLTASIAGMAAPTYVEAARSVFTSDVRPLMRRIRVPTRVVVGTRDGRTPPALSREIAALIEGAEYGEIEGARHLANLDRPEAFRAAVEPFLLAAG